MQYAVAKCWGDYDKQDHWHIFPQEKLENDRIY